MTRYPKSGKGKKWTQLELKAISHAWAGDVVSDGGGLSGEIRCSQDQATSIRFRYAFKWTGKVCWFQCGTWPTQTLDSIRASRDMARQLLKQGVNPIDKKRADHLAGQAQVEALIASENALKLQHLSLKDMFEAWLTDGVMRKDGNAELRRSFEKDVLPFAGAVEVRHITEHTLRKILKDVVARGCNRTTVVLFHSLVQLFTWAEKRKPWRQLLIEGKPTDLLEIRKIVSPEYDINDQRERTLSASEVLELKTIFSELDAAYDAAESGKKYSVPRPFKKEGELALWISLSTLCRIGELLKARWNDIDFEGGYWHIPLQNVKGSVGKKRAHQVWLSDFAVSKLRELQKITGKNDYLFPSRNHEGHVCVKSVSKQVGDRQTRFKNRTKALKNRRNDDSLVLSKGQKGEWTPHDLRRTGSTMMQALGVLPNVIDRCQNHVMDGSKVRRSYLHHEYHNEKREAWERLGRELQRILSDGVDSPIRRPTIPADGIFVPTRRQLHVRDPLTRINQISKIQIRDAVAIYPAPHRSL